MRSVDSKQAVLFFEYLGVTRKPAERLVEHTRHMPIDGLKVLLNAALRQRKRKTTEEEIETR